MRFGGPEVPAEKRIGELARTLAQVGLHSEEAVALLATTLLAGSAFAQTSQAQPPANAKKLSEMIDPIELNFNFLKQSLQGRRGAA